jgi:hypothetical protein
LCLAFEAAGFFDFEPQNIKCGVIQKKKLFLLTNFVSFLLAMKIASVASKIDKGMIGAVGE